MVFHAIKNLFSPSNTHTLYKNNKKLVTATLSIKPHLLTLNHIDIPFNRIYNLKHTTNIAFTYQNNQYRLEGNNLQSIYDQFVTLIKSKQLVFNAKNTKYYKSNKLIESDVDVCIYKQNNFYLIIVKDEVLHEEEITDENKYSVEPGGCAFIWTLMHENVPVTFRIEFARQIDYLEYLSKYTKCIMKHEIEDNETEQKIEGRSYNTANRAYLDSNENISSNAVNSELFASSFHETNEEMSHLFDTSSDESDNKNKDLTVSNQNKAFVTRGSSIGIFDLQNENIDFQSTINLNIDPSKILHHNNNLIVMDDQSSNKLYNVDLERGNITDEWDLNRQITDYFDSQKTQSGDIVALNDNSLFKIDLRTDKKIVSENNYKTKTNFTCGMSSKEGDLVIANKRGDLRLYDNLEKRARKLLHGLGDEIYSLDSSIDGRYVVCTTHKYLLFYDLSLQEIVPKRLQLRSEHLVYMNDVKFTPAKFNNANNCIVTSSGRFVITWNVSDVNSNIYSIKKCKDVVVADSFTSGENILVAMPNDVKIVNRKKLKNTDKISKTDK